MAKESITETEELLELETITEPFDLATALAYIKDYNEYIRCKTETDDFCIYKDVQRRPAVVNGRRRLVEVETLSSFDRWDNPRHSFEIGDMLDKKFYIMNFDEEGNPDWTEPAGGSQDAVNKEE